MIALRFLLSFLFLFTLSFSQGQPIRLLKQGCIKESEFLVEFPMKNYLDLIMVEVVIGGETYDFMFDTGADVSVISEDIINEMNLQPEKHCTIEDSKKRKRKTGLLAIPEIQIGGISFQSTAAAIEDLGTLNTVLSCFSIDGIIGNNLIRLAAWQIDYQKNIIRVTDDFDRLEIPSDAHKVSLQMGITGAAKLELTYDNIKDKLTFDTGSNGGISTSMKAFERLKSADNGFQYVKAHGDQSSGLYGSRQGDMWHGYVSNLQLGDVSINNRIVKFEADAAKTIGNRFFKNFIVSMDWAGSTLYLQPAQPVTCAPLMTYGFEFKPDYSNNGFRIGVLWDNDTLYKKQPKLGSKVLRINEEDFANLSKENFCTYLKQGINQRYNDQIKLVILEEGVEKEIVVRKTQILPQ